MKTKIGLVLFTTLVIFATRTVAQTWGTATQYGGWFADAGSPPGQPTLNTAFYPFFSSITGSNISAGSGVTLVPTQAGSPSYATIFVVNNVNSNSFASAVTNNDYLAANVSFAAGSRYQLSELSFSGIFQAQSIYPSAPGAGNVSQSLAVVDLTTGVSTTLYSELNIGTNSMTYYSPSFTPLEFIAGQSYQLRFYLNTTSTSSVTRGLDNPILYFQTTSSISIAGNVYDDANGLTDKTVNGTGTNAGGTLYAILYDNTIGSVAGTTAVASNGTYSFTASLGDNYTVYLSTSAGTVGQTTVPTASLPSGWVNTGENIGTSAGSVGTPNGILALGTSSANITNADFGIEEPPTANAVTGSNIANTGSTSNIYVPTLNGTDPEQGTFSGTDLLDTVVIKTIPTTAMGVLYYNGIAIPAGDTIKNYNPVLLTFTPTVGYSGTATFTYSEVDAALQASTAATVSMLFTVATPFTCSSTAYQVGAAPASNSTLYSYNVNTGSKTAIAALTADVNAIGYSTVDNLIWGGTNVNGQIVRIDATGATTLFTIPNLPATYNNGDVLPGGYLFLYEANGTKYYVVDINPAHANYLQLVNPAAGYALATSTYGTSLSGGATAVSISDWAYNASTGLLTGLINPTSFKVATINPTTGVVAISSTAVTGSVIQSETAGYGAVFFDPSGNFYVFSNAQGNFYKINLTTNTAVLLSTQSSLSNNDGASCPNAVLSYSITGNVYDDANGLTDNTVNGTGTNTGNTLYAVLYDSATGLVADTAIVPSTGVFTLAGTPGDTLAIEITTTVPTVGGAKPARTLPSGWKNTGENLGSGAGSDGLVNGILSLGVVTANVTYADFGIVQCPNGLSITATAAPTIVCASAGTSISLKSIPSGGITPYASYTWTGNGLTATNIQNPSANPTATGTYTVTVVDAVGCTATGTTATVTYDNTQPSISVSCNSGSVQLYENNGVSWYWATTSGGRFYTSSAYSHNSDSSTSHLQGPFINFTGSYSVQITDANGCTSTGGTTVGACSTLLADNFVSLTAQRQANIVQLQWKTASETAVSNYIIERSIDGVNFETAGSVKALDTNGANYSFTDDVSSIGCVTLYYKIKQANEDGISQYSNTIIVNCNANDAAQYVLKAYPNPVFSGGTLTVSYSMPGNTSGATLVITRITGAVCGQQTINNYVPGTVNSIPVTLNSNMAAGTYFLRIVSDKWISKTIKIIKAN